MAETIEDVFFAWKILKLMRLGAQLKKGVVYGDKSGSIHPAKNLIGLARSKDIEICHQIIRDV